MDVKDRLSALRKAMREAGLSAYVVPGNDPHASEYMAAHWCEMQWLSGFSGEAGTMVVTLDKALLWTDSRYYLQAGIELKDSTIELMRESDIDCPSITDWLCEELKIKNEKLKIGVNPEMFSVNDFGEWRDKLSDAGIQIKSIDLIKPLWTEGRPAIPADKLYPYSADFAGETVESKLARMREIVNRKSSNGKWALVTNALDEIAWLLNIRGNDVEYNPVVIAYVVLQADKCTLFVDAHKIDSPAQNYLDFNSIDVQPYEAVFDYIRSLQGTVLYDGARVNEALYEAIPEACKKVNTKSPILIDKAKKNAVELEGERIAMRQDSAALTRFFKWLEEEAFSNDKRQTTNDRLTEWDLMEKLHEFRLMGENFVEESFGTIAGYKGNGAIVHYAATKDNCAEVHPEGMLLLDSGGQYLDGTTDITRTVWLGGDIPEQAKLDYTYVLKGHIALQTVRFPRGTRGNQLDALAKQYMWEAGITFGHGTGHGVGHFLGCHEGPQNVRTDNNPTVLEVGHVISDEPGIYRTGEWGIRTENLITVIPAPLSNEALTGPTTNDEWLTFETLTLCFYDTSLIEWSLMTPAEIAWLNAYHERVYKETAPLLNADEAAFLAKKCAPIAA
ncbi:MAG: aminopeptidase P family N-terminal domain-containing protein [Paludibacteraceae bacterium]|nr:aminopeptidase P family N-terminal domain-containing protein [Paludibacteraceae bacterium]